MNNSNIKIIAISIISIFILNSFVSAEEQIIQNENMSFEKCLNVIKVSEDKLSLTPQLSASDQNRRIAVFTLSDGTLTITCDREEGTVTVSTNTD